jgi:hypothetical protein
VLVSHPSIFVAHEATGSSFGVALALDNAALGEGAVPCPAPF